ncbi:MAG: hypothetical protein K9N51_11240 [Candidatus Pacebacteria bacterium]|nr:hypothetical protein [Candidatus Paceibacterota bacterium]
MGTNNRRREHGVIDESSVRTVGMDPVQARHVIREEEDLKYPLLPSSLQPPVCRVHVADDSIGTLANGLGANWPAVGQGEQAYPRNDDEDGWRKVFAGMTDAGVKWVRFWLDPAGVVEQGRAVGEHRLLQRLDRLQEWAVEQDATIMLELCRIPEDFVRDAIHDAPADPIRYVRDYVVPLVTHVMRERRCDRIRQLCLFNEPFNADVTPYIFFPPDGQDPLRYYLEIHEILRAALDAASLNDIGLIGPNTANLFQRHIEMFEDKGLAERVKNTFTELDCHMWRMRFDYYPPSKRWPGYPMTEGIERYLKPTLAASRRLGKRLSLTETGAMYFNESPTTDRTTRHDAFLVSAEEIVRAINVGVSGALVWSFVNSGCVDGQWGWVGTRERGFAPVDNLLNGYTVLMKHQKVGAAIHPCTVARSDFAPFISAAAIVSKDKEMTLWLVNDHPVENICVEVWIPKECGRGPLQVFRKGFAPELQVLDPLAAEDVMSLTLPGMSLTTVTTLGGNKT